MKKVNWQKSLICLVLCFVLVMSVCGCSKGNTSSTDNIAELEYGVPEECVLCPDKEYCCFCYQYGDCVCDEVAQGEDVTSGGETSGGETSGGDNSGGSGSNRKPISNSGSGSNTTSGKYDPKSLKGKTITIMRQWEPYASGNNTAHDNWNNRVAELEKKYDFDIVEKKWSGTLEAEILAGVKPAGQLYQVTGDWVANYAIQDFIAPWNDAMKATGIDMTSDAYCDFSVQLCNYNNKQYAIGVEEGKMMSQVVYNKKLTSEFADIEKLMDNNEWTWEAMTKIAKKVKDRYPEKWGIGMDREFGVYGMVASNGGQLVSVSKDGTVGSNLNDKRVREALEQINQWINVDKVAFPTTNKDFTYDYLLKELIKGNIAFTFNEDICYSILKSDMKADDYGIAYLPMGPSANQYYACMESSWPYVMPKAYADQAADLLFVVDALYQLQPGYTKDTQFRDLYIRSFSNNTPYNRVKNMHRTLKPASIIEIKLRGNVDFPEAILPLYQGKMTVGEFIDSYHGSFDTYMKENWGNFKFTGNIN